MSRRPQLTGRAAILAVVVCAIAMSLAYPVREYIAQRRQIAALQEEKSRELAELRALEERHRQQSDPDVRRQELRTRLHYCGPPPEKCFVIHDPTPEPGQAQARAEATEPPPWYQTLWESVEAADRGAGRRAGE
jgi:hypothetical protein